MSALLAPLAVGMSVPVHETPNAPVGQSVIAGACTQLFALVRQQYEVPPAIPAVSQMSVAIASYGVSVPVHE
jgi:hypothetical protein